MKKVELNTSKLKLQKEKVTDLIEPKTQNNFGAEASRPTKPTSYSVILEQCNLI